MLTNPSTLQPVTSVENGFPGEYLFSPSGSGVDGDTGLLEVPDK
jgi:hypothetical protein